MDSERPYTRKQVSEAAHSMLRTPTEYGRSLQQYMFDLSLPPVAELEGQRILDLGSGMGLSFARDLKEAGVNADVVSLSPAFAKDGLRKLALERDVSQEYKVAHLSVAGMGEELPFAGSSFDRVVCHSVIEYVDSQKRYFDFLKEIVRVLSTHGVADIGPITQVNSRYRYPMKVREDELGVQLGQNISATWVTMPPGGNIWTLHLQKD